MRMSRRAGIYSPDDTYAWRYLYYEGDQWIGWQTGYGYHGTVNMDYAWNGHRCIYVSTMSAAALAEEEPQAYAYTLYSIDLSEYDLLAAFIAKPNEAQNASSTIQFVRDGVGKTFSVPDLSEHGRWHMWDISDVSYSARIRVDTLGFARPDPEIPPVPEYHTGIAISGIALLKTNTL